MEKQGKTAIDDVRCINGEGDVIHVRRFIAEDKNWQRATGYQPQEIEVPELDDQSGNPETPVNTGTGEQGTGTKPETETGEKGTGTNPETGTGEQGTPQISPISPTESQQKVDEQSTVVQPEQKVDEKSTETTVETATGTSATSEAKTDDVDEIPEIDFSQTGMNIGGEPGQSKDNSRRVSNRARQ